MEKKPLMAMKQQNRPQDATDRLQKVLLREMEQVDWSQYRYDSGKWNLFQMAFRVARIAQGVGERERVRTSAKVVMHILKDWLEEHQINNDMFHESLFNCWDAVKQPSGAKDPVEAAHEHCEAAISQDGKMIPAYLLPRDFAEWPNRKYRAHTSILFRMAVYLSKGGTEHFYLPSRKTGKLFDRDRTTAAAMVRILFQKGCFCLYEKHTPKRAPRYMLTERALALAKTQDEQAKTDREQRPEEQKEQIEQKEQKEQIDQTDRRTEERGT